MTLGHMIIGNCVPVQIMIVTIITVITVNTVIITVVIAVMAVNRIRRSPQGTVFRTPPSRPRARCSKIRGDMYRAAAYQAEQYLAMHEQARASSHASHTMTLHVLGGSDLFSF